MTIHSDHPKKTYLKALKSGMDSPFALWSERATGFFLGPFFCVTYHSGWEWNRRITNEKNTALGIIRNEGEGCKISFVNIKGLLAPHYLLLLWVLLASSMIISSQDPSLHPMLLLLSIPFTLVIAAVSALFESLTERSEEGQRELISILWDPVKLFSHRFET